MNIEDYLLPIDGHDWQTVVSQWHWLFSAEFTIWFVNRYGDIFWVKDSGEVLMLDVGRGTVTELAKSRDDFVVEIDHGDNASQWLMIPLVDKCVATGLTLAPGQCYSFKIPPVLGGEYSVENTEVVDMSVHFDIHAQIHAQIKDMPDGTRVNFSIRPR